MSEKNKFEIPADVNMATVPVTGHPTAPDHEIEVITVSTDQDEEAKAQESAVHQMLVNPDVAEIVVESGNAQAHARRINYDEVK